uniref:Uncharacterized protein n=1 Tax=Anopheles farauti TaxID=69004 RepID=A0A182QEK4_9DIPT
MSQSMASVSVFSSAVGRRLRRFLRRFVLCMYGCRTGSSTSTETVLIGVQKTASGASGTAFRAGDGVTSCISTGGSFAPTIVVSLMPNSHWKRTHRSGMLISIGKRNRPPPKYGTSSDARRLLCTIEVVWVGWFRWYEPAATEVTTTTSSSSRNANERWINKRILLHCHYNTQHNTLRSHKPPRQMDASLDPSSNPSQSSPSLLPDRNGASEWAGAWHTTDCPVPCPYGPLQASWTDGALRYFHHHLEPRAPGSEQWTVPSGARLLFRRNLRIVDGIDERFTVQHGLQRNAIIYRVLLRFHDRRSLGRFAKRIGRPGRLLRGTFRHQLHRKNPFGSAGTGSSSPVASLSFSRFFTLRTASTTTPWSLGASAADGAMCSVYGRLGYRIRLWCWFETAARISSCSGSSSTVLACTARYGSSEPAPDVTSGLARARLAASSQAFSEAGLAYLRCFGYRLQPNLRSVVDLMEAETVGPVLHDHIFTERVYVLVRAAHFTVGVACL